MSDEHGKSSGFKDEEPADAPSAETTVVGIGASAGGLAALKTFFEHVPEDCGLAFVVVVHLSPEHKSHLAELLQPHVKSPVQQVMETIALEPNHIYVIPPNANLNTIDTHLRLSPLEEQRSQRAPIDHFFRTLAKTHNGSAVAVILTGTGTDGTLGIKAIKAKGGLTIVQDPIEAEYDGMPQSAVATGVIDLVLPLKEIPPAIAKFVRTKPEIVALEEGEEAEQSQRRHLQKVMGQLRVRTGRDFSRYKRSTILRRIQRRMQLRHVVELEDYVTLLREESEEAPALADDLLITVTNFFRDPEVFEKLERDIIPKLFESRQESDDLRAWTVGCATGEEAYSLAILLLEEAERREMAPRLQVFASDLHERSLAMAREGFYLGDIEAEVSPNRLKRFFIQEDGGYRIRQEVRDLVVFAPHNLLSDPPFSRIDLVTCRNLLIYLQRDVQRDVIDLFHYALRPDGYLVLGSAETLDASELFRLEEKKHCQIYQKRHVPAPEPQLPVFPITRHRLSREVRAEPEGDRPPLTYGNLHQHLLQRYGPPSMLVTAEDKIAHLSERAGRYLQHPAGQITASVSKLVREELRIELRAALHSARHSGEHVRSKPVWVHFIGETRAVVLSVRAGLEPSEEGYALIVFEEGEEAEMPPAASSATAEGDGQGRESQLEAELHLIRQRLHAIIEEYETSQGEMKASNEELQSANEELRSTMEELETSKEELQSINEELNTVNQENRHKVEELAQLSGDLQNLLAATNIATLFLDRDLRIMRFTPKLGELFNVRITDRGRPILDITHRLGDGQLIEDARRVLQNLIPIEHEICDLEGRWYLTHILPYRSSEDRIEGVVLTFVDITERKRREEALRKSEEQFRLLIEGAQEYAILMIGQDASITMWSAGAQRIFGYTEEEALQRKGEVLFTEEDRAAGILAKEMETALRDGRASDDRWHLRKDGTFFWATGVMEALKTPEGSLHGFVKLLRDNTGQKEVEDERDRQRAMSEAFLDTLPAGLVVADAEGRFIRENALTLELWGASPQADSWRDYGNLVAWWPGSGERLEAEEWAMTRALLKGEVTRNELVEIQRANSEERRFCLNNVAPIRNPEGKITGAVAAMLDVTDRLNAEEKLKQLNETLEERIHQRTKQVRDLASKLTRAEQEERRRVSQILHDDLQQILCGVETKIELLRQGLERGEHARLLDLLTSAHRWLKQAIKTTRQLTVELSPPILRNEGLVDALEWLKHQMRDLHQMDVSIEATDRVVISDNNLRIFLFQVVRELAIQREKARGDGSCLCAAGESEELALHQGRRRRLRHGRGANRGAGG